METAYDWITVVIFAALVTRFLHQSARQEASNDKLWNYLIPSSACAFANWLGNEGHHLWAGALIAATLAYIILYVVQPFQRPHKPD